MLNSYQYNILNTHLADKPHGLLYKAALAGWTGSTCVLRVAGETVHCLDLDKGDNLSETVWDQRLGQSSTQYCLWWPLKWPIYLLSHKMYYSFCKGCFINLNCYDLNYYSDRSHRHHLSWVLLCLPEDFLRRVVGGEAVLPHRPYLVIFDALSCTYSVLCIYHSYI